MKLLKISFQPVDKFYKHSAATLTCKVPT